MPRRPSLAPAGDSALGTTQARGLRPEEVSALKQESDRLLHLEMELNDREARIGEREQALLKQASQGRAHILEADLTPDDLLHADLRSHGDSKMAGLECLVGELQVQRDVALGERNEAVRRARVASAEADSHVVALSALRTELAASEAEAFQSDLWRRYDSGVAEEAAAEAAVKQVGVLVLAGELRRTEVSELHEVARSDRDGGLVAAEEAAGAAAAAAMVVAMQLVQDATADAMGRVAAFLDGEARDRVRAELAEAWAEVEAANTRAAREAEIATKLQWKLDHMKEEFVSLVVVRPPLAWATAPT